MMYVQTGRELPDPHIPYLVEVPVQTVCHVQYTRANSERKQFHKEGSYSDFSTTPYIHYTCLYYSFEDEAQTALFKDPVRTAL
jgi:hypothetical protein